MAVSIPLDFDFLSWGKSHPDQCQDTRYTERCISADINIGDLDSLCFRGPATLEMANSIGRHGALLDKCEYAAVTQHC